MNAGMSFTQGCTNGQEGAMCALMLSFLPAEWAPVVGGLIAIALVLLIALILRKVAHRLITRVVRRASSSRASLAGRLRGREPSTPEGLDAIVAERRRQRAETMGSVLKHIASIVILGTAVLTALDRLSIPITPLLTSVGIVGVAIGFGAQELVKDFIAGMFMLLEDQYGVGDVIDLGEVIGTVEGVGLRTTRVRDDYGTVWYVRNGEVARVGNKSQGYAQVVLDTPVPATMDLDQAGRAIKAAADSLWRDNDWADVILEEPQLLGIEQLTGDGAVLRLTAKTRPLQQWRVARELRHRVKQRLDARDTTR
jgi:small-conductance mechanosensitive channel